MVGGGGGGPMMIFEDPMDSKNVNMWGYNDKIPIKMPQILQSPGLGHSGPS